MRGVCAPEPAGGVPISVHKSGGGVVQRLADAAAEVPKDLDAFCDRVIGDLVGSAHDDDIAVLALRVGKQ